MPQKRAGLRNSAEFRQVYERGRRYDGRFMTAFVLMNDSEDQKLGITASRKMSGKAVDRNRAKRLLREAFRLNRVGFDGLQRKYDWVLNARRSLLKVKVIPVLEELSGIIARVAEDERASVLRTGI